MRSDGTNLRKVCILMVVVCLLAILVAILIVNMKLICDQLSAQPAVRIYPAPDKVWNSDDYHDRHNPGT